MSALLLALALACAAQEPPSLSFESGDAVRLRVTAAELARRPGARLVELEDPFYGRRKRYRAVPLKDLLAAAFGGSWAEDTLGELFFHASDGYRSHARVSTLMADGAMLAFADADAPEWEDIPKRGARPGPFYLVWTGAEQGPRRGFPWPWQIERVELASLEEKYPKAIPRGAEPDSPALRGWSAFRAHCISCHAMSGAGGDVGPDLNEPRGITRYQGKSFLKAFIRRPSAFRRTKMPDFPELTRAQLNDLLAYFEHMTRQAKTK